MTTLFISDLHLCAEHPDITRLFRHFMEQRAARAEALYILGDLFEIWIGDDAITSEHQAIITAIRSVVDNGTPVFFMHGNRDFLIGSGFEQASGCHIIPDPTVIDLYGEKYLLMHGDTLCTEDKEYQTYRKEVRAPGFQQDFLARPVAERTEIARHYRETSKEKSSEKPADIMDVTPSAVTDIMEQHQVKRLIHGHTHRPAIHSLEIDSQYAQRIVLGDWYQHGSVLSIDSQGCHLESFDNNEVLSTQTG